MTTKTFALSMPNGHGLARVLHLAAVAMPTGPAPDFDAEGAAVPRQGRPVGCLVDDVSAVPGVAVGWMRRNDGTFAPYEAPLDHARAERTAIIEQSCAFSIRNGFTSSALGSDRLYGSSDTAQMNLLHDAQDATGQDKDWRCAIACAEPNTPSDEAWPSVDHSAEQVAKVLTDFRAMRAAAQAKRRDLLKRIADAKDTASVEAVVW